MSVTVGVDGGQSEIRLRVSGEPDIYSAPGLSHLEDDTDTALVDTVAGLCDGRDRQIIRLVAGATTVPATEAERLSLAADLGRATGAGEVWLGGDDVTSHAGALDGATGVVLSVGTGVACLAIDAERGTHRGFDGAGYLVGDEGGGFWLGRHGIRAALAADEGRGPHTLLSESLSAQLGGLDGLAIRLHANPRAVDTIARTAVVVLAQAAAGDHVAASIVADAAARLVETATAAVRFLAPASAISVALGGRLLLGSDLLAEVVSGGIAAGHPEVAVFMAKGSSLDGACSLAESTTAGPYQRLLTMWSRS
jgi:N-acetylglucosamine kinase-like BadF-type ATPase